MIWFVSCPNSSLRFNVELHFSLNRNPMYNEIIPLVYNIICNRNMDNILV